MTSIEETIEKFDKEIGDSHEDYCTAVQFDEKICNCVISEFRISLKDSFTHLLDSAIERIEGEKKRGKAYWTVKEVDKKGKTATLNPVGSMAQGYVDGHNSALDKAKSILEEFKK